jgi:elongation factor 3
LEKSGASSSGPPPTHRDINAETAAAFITLQNFLPEELVIASASANTSKQPRYIILEVSLKFQASLVADLVSARTFNDAQTWHRCVGQYMSVWLNDGQAVTFADSLRMHYLAIDQVRGYSSKLSVFFYSTDCIVTTCCSS